MGLYFIEAGDAIKIGVSSEFNRRISNLQVGNCDKMKLLLTLEGSLDESKDLEYKLHSLLYNLRINGEWFQRNKFIYEIIDFLKINDPSYLDEWIVSKFEEEFGEALERLKLSLEKTLILGNVVFIEMLKNHIKQFLEISYSKFVFSSNLSFGVRRWIETRQTKFTHRDIASAFGLESKKEKNNVRQILFRLKKEGLIESKKLGSTMFFEKA